MSPTRGCHAGAVIDTFDAELWVWDARRFNTWTFVSLPAALAEEIKIRSYSLRGGFGSLRVRATVGTTTWQTSIFPDRARGSFALPIKKGVRRAEALDPGDVASVTLEVLDV